MGARARRLRQEAVLAALRLRGVEAPDHAEGAVRHHARLDLGGGLLRADQDHPQRSPALGDVEDALLDRAAPLARGVLVELVEHDEDRRRGPRRAQPLAGLEHLGEERPDDEALRAVVEAVQVDDGDLLARPVDAVAPGIRLAPAPQEVANVGYRRLEPPQEGLDAAEHDMQAILDEWKARIDS